MRIAYRDLVKRVHDLEPNCAIARLVEQSSQHPFGKITRRIIGQTGAFAHEIGLAAAAAELAKAVASINGLDADIRQSVIFTITENTAEASVAEPTLTNDLETTAVVACTPAAFLGMSIPQATTVALLRSMAIRAVDGHPWNFEWYRKEAFRLAGLADTPTDADVARSAMVSRIDTLWSGMAAECLYAMLRSGDVVIGDNLWVEQASPALSGWMYQSWLDKLAGIDWLTPDFVSQQYAGVSNFVAGLQANGDWAASVFDGEDLLEVSSTQVLKDWFGCFSIVAHGDAAYDNSADMWKIPFMSAREGVGVLMLRARLSERPVALLRGLRLPGVGWANTAPDCRSWEEDGRTMFDIDGEHVEAMDLTDRQAADNGVFYLRDEAGMRVRFWSMRPGEA